MADNNLQILQDPNDPLKVVFVHNGRRVFNLPWDLAIQVSRLTYEAAKKCEEYQVANRIIAQDALLIRTGAPFSFTNDPKIRAEAFKEAQWGTEARKGMPLRAVPSRASVRTPSLIKHPKEIKQ